VVFLKRAPAGGVLESIIRVEGWRDGAYAITALG
jgi:hypothetical protein